MNLVDKKIEDYCLLHSHRPSDICQKIEDYTWKNVAIPQMVTGAMVGSYLGFLVKAIRAKNILEVGTFTGYSALALAENTDGNVHTIDVDEETTAIAKNFWKESKHGHKITAHIGSGIDIIPSFKEEFDFIFIDADKTNYLNYFELCFNKLAANGIMIFDNCLWSGKVLEKNGDARTEYLKKLNQFLANRTDLYTTLLPIRDGLMCVTRKLN